MLFVSRTCFNEFLLLLDVMWVNKVLLLLLLLLLRLLRIGKVSVTARKKKAFRSRKRRKHSKAPKKLSTSMCTKTRNLLNTLMLRYLRKVQHIYSEFLADMSKVLPFIFCFLCCDWNFSPRVNIQRATGLDESIVQKDAKRILVLLFYDWAEKYKGSSGTNQKPELLQPIGTGPSKPKA